MAAEGDVIRDALRQHRLGWVEGRRACITCGWMPLDGSLLDFAEHQAEVARAAVQEEVGQVLSAHLCACSLVPECACGWVGIAEHHEDHVQALIAAALAGEG